MPAGAADVNSSIVRNMEQQALIGSFSVWSGTYNTYTRDMGWQANDVFTNDVFTKYAAYSTKYSDDVVVATR